MDQNEANSRGEKRHPKGDGWERRRGCEKWRVDSIASKDLDKEATTIDRLHCYMLKRFKYGVLANVHMVIDSRIFLH